MANSWTVMVMICVVAVFGEAQVWGQSQPQKNRLIIFADMGNEPDETQQITHMLLYSNMFELEGLIAVTNKRRKIVLPELFYPIIDAYGEVVENLRKHADGWPTEEALRGMVAAGAPVCNKEGIGEGNHSSGSQLVIDALLRDDLRPVYIVVNAGANVLGQALFELGQVKTHEEMEVLASKIIVYQNGVQDDSGAWIMLRHPRIRWWRSHRQTYGWGGPENHGDRNLGGLGPYTWEPYERTNMGQRLWTREHIQNDHGALGAQYPDRGRPGVTLFLEGGGTTPWIGLANHGLFSIEHMYWGGWGGRFSRERKSSARPEDQKYVLVGHEMVRTSERAQSQAGEFSVYTADSEVDTWVDAHGEQFSDLWTPVHRFRRAMFNDLRGRMDWCVSEYGDANHNPIAVVNGDDSDDILMMQVVADTELTFDASGTSDPDGDAVSIFWWVYDNAGTYSGDVALSETNALQTTLRVPADAAGSEIHLILEVRDEGTDDNGNPLSLYDYRRVVLSVGDG